MVRVKICTVFCVVSASTLIVRAPECVILSITLNATERIRPRLHPYELELFKQRRTLLFYNLIDLTVNTSEPPTLFLDLTK
jgi:hypothetical protein